MFHRGDLSVKGETGSARVKGETISANFWQGKVQIYRQFLRNNGDVTSVSGDLSRDHEGRDGKREGGNDKCEFLARESANLSPILARQW